MPDDSLSRILQDVRATRASDPLTRDAVRNLLVAVAVRLRDLPGVPELELGDGLVGGIVFGDRTCGSPLPVYDADCQVQATFCIGLMDLANALDRLVEKLGEVADLGKILDDLTQLLESFQKGSPACPSD